MIQVRQRALADGDQFTAVADGLDVARIRSGAKWRGGKIASLADLRGAGRLDVVAPGKDGLHVFFNEGS